MRLCIIGMMCALLMACGNAGKARLPSAAALSDARLTVPPPTARMPTSVFLSGHSLVDVPYPAYLATISNALGEPLSWQRKYMVGSSIRQRGPLVLPPGDFNALIITEQHGVLNSLVWEDTHRFLREAHDAFFSRKPDGQTWFLIPWLSLDDPAQPQRWMAYEKAAAFVWQCMISRINRELHADGRADQIRTIPASLALVYLVQTLQQEGKPPVFSDDVHLTPAGKFYLALVTAGSMSGGLPADLPARLAAVDGVAPDQVQTMVPIAQRYLAGFEDQPELSEGGCRQFLAESFIDDYWNYYRDAVLAKNSSALKARWSVWRMRRQSTPALLSVQ
jgi:hypothetical protein